jgi:hypothetical protein
MIGQCKENLVQPSKSHYIAQGDGNLKDLTIPKKENFRSPDQ